MSKIKGGFFFRDEGEGCLTSKYCNEEDPKYLTTCPECCKIIGKSGQEKFVGKYSTVWLESDGPNYDKELSIERKGDLYHLKWSEKGGDIIYEGTGMLVDGLLVGGYWSVK